MKQIKAIQTSYKGYLFRSRLEARWAVFFDALGVEWEYEPEGYNLGDLGWYLPDFLIPLRSGIRLFVEVKPKGVSFDAKYNAFEKAICDKPVISAIVNGDPRWFFQDSYVEGKGSLGGFLCYGCGNILKSTSWDIWKDRPQLQWYCFICDMDKPTNSVFDNNICIENYKGDNYIENGSNINLVGELCLSAANKARSARFEHGETPL